MDEQEKYQTRLEHYEASIEDSLLDGTSYLFINSIESVFEDEDAFIELVKLLNKLVSHAEWFDDAHELRAFLRRKIADFARHKAEQEFPNIYWRNQ
jgi:hypothetical protein